MDQMLCYGIGISAPESRMVTSGTSEIEKIAVHVTTVHDFSLGVSSFT